MNKKIKYSVISTVIISIIFWYYSLSAEEKDLSWYDLYIERNKQLCTQYKPDKPIFSSKNEYKDFGSKSDENGNKTSNNNAVDWNDLEVAKYQYKDTMNSIYKCALLNAQERSMKFILDTLKEKNEVTAFTKQYESKLDRLEITRKVNKCDNTNKLNKANDQKNVIQQTTFEICKYKNYLEYLLEYNSVIANVLEQDKQSSINWWTNLVSPDQITETYNITTIANLEKKKKQAINDEIERAYKIYPVAFQAYTEYENNLPVHDLLTMLRNDFIEFRLDLHKNLNPINQVVYKISNAMKE
jgi:hypothetical protein